MLPFALAFILFDYWIQRSKRGIMIAGYFQSTAGPSNTILICEGVRMLAINSEF